MMTFSQAASIEISSLHELIVCAQRSQQTVTMKPGVYRLSDTLPLHSMAERRRQKQFHWLAFSGSNNHFNLHGVILEVDTTLREALRPPIHTSEFIITGQSNTLQGLTIVQLGNGTSPGGSVLSIRGTGTILRDCTFTVRGSYPYGYGDLFGKGGGSIINHHKQSGILIAADETRLFGCHLIMRSFGHGYYIQNDAANVHLEDCTVEGEMRSTDAMLAETSGPAFEVGFRTVMKNRAGENRVTPGYMKSLAEDGFRTYGQHRSLTFKNCVAKNMRGGFELRSKTGVHLENCTAIGNERAFWISSDAQVIDCRGDAQYGPLLFLEGDNATVHLQLLPAESDATVHALATIHGTGHQITVTEAHEASRTHPLPILLGYRQPGAGEGMAPISEGAAHLVTLRNETSMPIIVGPQANQCTIVTRGPVEENAGRAISLTTETVQPAVTLLCASPPVLAARPGSGFRLDYRWEAAPMDKDYQVFVHVTDQDGLIVLQDDHRPPRPTTRWSGSVTYTRTVPLEQWAVRDQRTVDIALPEGSYDVRAGLYHAEDGRSVLNPGPGVVPLGDASYRIATLHVNDQAPVPGPGEPTLDLTGYRMTFNEDFDDFSISAWGPAGEKGTRWIAHTPWYGDFGDARFTDPQPGFPFTVQDGILRIEAREVDGRWRSGLLSAVDPQGRGFRQQYGYFECRAKLPKGPGTWPAFWLMGLKSLKELPGNTGPRVNPEIDVLEHYGHWPWKFHYALHQWGLDGAESRHAEKRFTVFGTEDDFHTYGVLIDREHIILYFDGVELHREPTPESVKTPLFPLVNLALGPGWPTDLTPNPSYLYVDYVRVWQKSTR